MTSMLVAPFLTRLAFACVTLLTTLVGVFGENWTNVLSKARGQTIYWNA